MANNMLQSLLFSGGSSGGDGGVLVVHDEEAGTVSTLDKTWKEIHDAPFAVLNNVLGTGTTYAPILYTGTDEGDYVVVFRDLVESKNYAFTTDSENGYPYRELK